MKMSPVTALEHTAISDHRPQRNWPWAQSPHGGNSLGCSAGNPSILGWMLRRGDRHGRPLLLAHGIRRACLGKHLPEPGRASNSGQKLLKSVSFSGMFVSDSAETGPKEESRLGHEDTHRGGTEISVQDGRRSLPQQLNGTQTKPTQSPPVQCFRLRTGFHSDKSVSIVTDRQRCSHK